MRHYEPTLGRFQSNISSQLVYTLVLMKSKNFFAFSALTRAWPFENLKKNHDWRLIDTLIGFLIEHVINGDGQLNSVYLNCTKRRLAYRRETPTMLKETTEKKITDRDITIRGKQFFLNIPSI